MLSLELSLLKEATLQCRAGLLSLHSPAGWVGGGQGAGRVPYTNICRWVHLGWSMAVDKDRLSSCTAGFGGLLSCVLATVYLALTALLSRSPLLMYSPASDWSRLARGPGDEPITVTEVT